MSLKFCLVGVDSLSIECQECGVAGWYLYVEQHYWCMILIDRQGGLVLRPRWPSVKAWVAQCYGQGGPVLRPGWPSVKAWVA